MEPTLGIDFGTTYSAMAWRDPKSGHAQILKNAEGEEKTPSAVYFGASEVVVGKPALHVLEDAEESRRVVLSCKRHLQSNAVRALPGRRVTMVETAAAILAKLKRDAEELHFHAPVRRAVVTCPAAFGELERERIEQAARQAGFAEVKLLEEPVAAALAYARHGLQVGQHILVYDLGGGTFDLAVLLREGESGFRLALEPRGLAACGGDDFDRALYDYLDERLRAALNLTAAAEFDLNRLLRCRDCKESLSHLPSSLFSVYVDGRPFKERVERQTFENLIHDRLEHTIRLTQDLVADAARRGQPVDTVVLIGGSARIPQVAARLAEVLPVPPHKWQQQDVAVALGAAWWAITPMTVSVAADGCGDYRTLEQALAAVPDDSTIHLQSGEYRLAAPLLIEKSVRLLGVGMDSTFVVGDGHGYVLKISGAERFGAQGITFRHEGTTPADVVIVADSELKMSQCLFTGGWSDTEGTVGNGLSLLGTCHGRINLCRMERNSLSGIHVSQQTQPTLDDNICEWNKCSGITYSGGSSGVARKNRCGRNQYHGIAVVEQAQPNLEENFCEENQQNGIGYFGCSGGVAHKNRCENNGYYGIGVNQQAQPTLEDNICESNKSSDLVLLLEKEVATLEVKIPALPESVTDGTLVNWKKKPGESVKQGENLVDLETDKVVLEIPAPSDGILGQILRQEGEIVTTGDVIATLAVQQLKNNTVQTLGTPAIQNIHGWSTAQVQQLQKEVAQALGMPVVFSDLLKDGGKGPDMLVIPPGSFLMGSPGDEPEEDDEELLNLLGFRISKKPDLESNSDEKQQHWVKIAKPFAIGRYAVTFAEYDSFCFATGREKPINEEGWKRGNRPVININWFDALAYAEWLTQQTGHQYRLPTEAEWEYAARAGTTTAFWWGSSITTKQANYDGSVSYNGGKVGTYRGETVAVDEFQPNPWGLYQVHGNVCEWTGSEVIVPLYSQQEGGKQVVEICMSIRGGSWEETPAVLRSACRSQCKPAIRLGDLGVRLARIL